MFYTGSELCIPRRECDCPLRLQRGLQGDQWKLLCLLLSSYLEQETTASDLASGGFLQVLQDRKDFSLEVCTNKLDPPLSTLSDHPAPKKEAEE